METRGVDVIPEGVCPRFRIKFGFRINGALIVITYMENIYVNTCVRITNLP
jgi:hypothetical protein